MRIGIAWAKAILLGLMLAGAGLQGVFCNQAAAQPPMTPAPVYFDEPVAAGQPGVFGDAGDGRHLPYVGAERVYGTGDIANPRWFDISADYMILNRDNASRFVAFSTLGANGGVVLSTNDLNFDGSSGFRVSGNYLVGPGRSLEGSYFGTFNFADRAQAVSDANLLLFSPFSDFGASPPILPQADAAVLHTLAYSSNLHSAELNLRQRWVSPNARVHSSLLAGVRYLGIDEDMEFRTFTGAGDLNYLAQTSNDMVGFQLGGDLNTSVCPWLMFGGEAKAGVFGNDAQLRNVITVNDALAGNVITNFREAGQTNNASFVGEAGVFMILRFERLSLKAGYQALVVTGLALAPENFDRNRNFGARPVIVNDGGSAFYHGGQMGFEWTY